MSHLSPETTLLNIEIDNPPDTNVYARHITALNLHQPDSPRQRVTTRTSVTS